MKKKLALTILAILMFMLFMSCNSCTSGKAQEAIKFPTEYRNDVLIIDTATYRTFITGNDIKILDQDTAKVIFIKKIIEPVEIDTTWNTRRETIYNQLDKTENDLKIQQKTIDSMIVVKKR